MKFALKGAKEMPGIFMIFLVAVSIAVINRVSGSEEPWPFVVSLMLAGIIGFRGMRMRQWVIYRRRHELTAETSKFECKFCLGLAMAAFLVIPLLHPRDFFPSLLNFAVFEIMMSVAIIICYRRRQV